MWYGLIGNDQANEPWLDEALSTYSELLFMRGISQLATWWRENRIDFHEPQGWVDSTIYEFGPRTSTPTGMQYICGEHCFWPIYDKPSG